MKNTAMMKNLIDRYNKVSYTHNYIFGFTDRDNVYMTFTDESMLPYVCMLDKSSRNCGYALRFKPNKSQKEILKMAGARLMCSVEYFNSICADSKYNRGEVFEKLVTEKFDQTWKKDHVPFTEAGDIEINGVAYQIKFEKATFCNEKSIANLESEKASTLAIAD